MKRLGAARHLVRARRAVWGGWWGGIFHSLSSPGGGQCEPNWACVGGGLQLVALGRGAGGRGRGDSTHCLPCRHSAQALRLLSVPLTPQARFVLLSAVIFPRTSTQPVPSGLSQLSLWDSWSGTGIRVQGVRLRHAKAQL